MTKLIALVPVWYDGKERQPGEAFHCHGDTDVRILTAPDVFGGPKARIADDGEVPPAKVDEPDRQEQIAKEQQFEEVPNEPSDSNGVHDRRRFVRKPKS